MNKKSQVVFYVLLFLVAISFYTVYAKNNRTIKQLENKLYLSEEKIFYLQDSWMKSLELECTVVDKEQKVIGKNGDCFLREVLKGNELFFYFPGSLCGRCNKVIIDEFSKHIEEIGKENIVVFVPFNDVDDFEILNDEYDWYLPKYYGLPNNHLKGIKIVDEKKAILFQIDSDFQTKNAFIPGKNNLKLFSDYLSLVGFYL